MSEEEIEQELENNKVDIVFPTNEGYVKVENIERVRDVIISKSVRVSKLIEGSINCQSIFRISPTCTHRVIP